MPSLIELFNSSPISQENGADLEDMSFIFLIFNSVLNDGELSGKEGQVQHVDPSEDSHKVKIVETGKTITIKNNADVYQGFSSILRTVCEACTS